jgi:FtsZ-interacting cell division protein ZipA
MSSGTTAVIIVVAIVVIALIIVGTMAGRRRRLQQQFGPEYDRAVSEQDSRLRAEAELAGRQRRVRKLDIQPLSDAARTRYLAEWQAIQEQFVDSPEEAVTNAYALLTTVMKERGYPVTDDEQVMADLSVEHANTVGHFRSAQEITRNVAHGGTNTEDMRQALIHYRALFSDLLGEPVDPAGQTPARHARLSEDDMGTYQVTPAATQPNGLSAEPTEPALSAEPAEPALSAEPAEPALSAEPAEPALSAEPAEPTDDEYVESDTSYQPRGR